MLTKDNVCFVVSALFSNMELAPEDVELTNFILIEFVSVTPDLFEKEMTV